MNHFIFFFACKLSKISSIMILSSKSKKYILFDFNLSAQSNFRSIDIWFSDEMIIKKLCFFYMLNFLIITRNFSIMFWLSYIVISFDNFVSFFALFDWITLCDDFFALMKFLIKSCVIRFTYAMKISFAFDFLFDFKPRRRFMKNSSLLSSRCKSRLIYAVRISSESISFFSYSINVSRRVLDEIITELIKAFLTWTNVRLQSHTCVKNSSRFLKDFVRILLLNSKRKFLLDYNFLSRRYVNMFMIEFEDISINFLLWITRRIREFDLKLILINTIKFSQMRMTKNLSIKLIVNFFDVIMFSFIKILHFNSFIMWNFLCVDSLTFLSSMMSNK